jgi:hypothetical protein
MNTNGPEVFEGSEFACANCGKVVRAPQSGCMRCMDDTCSACFCPECYRKSINRCLKCGGDAGLMFWANPFPGFRFF